jgi:ParB family chromosome partitioning protein
MSRKNLLASISGTKPVAQDAATRPMGLAGRGALGAVTRTIDNLAVRANSAKELEAKLAAGETVVELDPALVDRSFMPDRMDDPDDGYAQLRDAIREHGQASPILVRPHPDRATHYQVAFGHRRLRAAAELGRPVRAIVKQLSDVELVLAQGQENSARTDLSFMERAQFAKRLEMAGYTRDTIMAALGVEKTTLSRLIAVATDIPPAVVAAVGPARSVGRDRWMELVSQFRAASPATLPALLAADDFTSLPSDARFEAVLQACRDPSPAPVTQPESIIRPKLMIREKPRSWQASDGREIARIAPGPRSFVVSIDRAAAPEFGEYLVTQLQRLYDEYAGQQKPGRDS